jgi:hypothetical protein
LKLKRILIPLILIMFLLSLSIVKADVEYTETHLFLNDTEGNYTICDNLILNATAVVNVSGSDLYIYCDGNPEIQTASPVFFYSNVSEFGCYYGIGIYNITPNYEGNESFEPSSVTYWLNITNDSSCYEEEPCIEDWNCTAWSECANKLQTRVCTDLEECGTEINKPIESQSCSMCSVSNDLIILFVIMFLAIIFAGWISSMVNDRYLVELIGKIIFFFIAFIIIMVVLTVLGCMI